MSYPNVLRRYLGTLLDIFVFWLFLFLLGKTPFAQHSTASTLGVLGGFVLLYDPLLTVYLCTFGQAAMRMRVRDEKTLGRITLSQAYERLFMKYFLGWLSALTIPAQKRRQAIHDLLTDTIVIEAKT